MKIFHEEDYYGFVEYKRYFNDKDIDRIENYKTQLNFRINEGCGKAIYLIGINDNGTVHGLSELEIEKNMNFLNDICKSLNLYISLKMNCIFDKKKFLIVKIKSYNFIEII